MQHQEPVHVFERLVGTMKVGELAERAGLSVSDLIDRIEGAVEEEEVDEVDEVAEGAKVAEIAKKSSPKRVRSVSADSILSALPENGSWVSLRSLRRRFRIAVDVLDGTLKQMISGRSILATKDEGGEVFYKRSGR